MAREAAERGTGGALGPALAAAIGAYNAALAELARAEQGLEDAQRAVDGARARLTGLAGGARATGSRALVAVEEPDPATG